MFVFSFVFILNLNTFSQLKRFFFRIYTKLFLYNPNKFRTFALAYTLLYINMANTTLRIKDLCREKGLTKAEVAEKLGIKPSSFSQMLSRNGFTLPTLEKLAEAFDVPVWQLFVEENKEESNVFGVIVVDGEHIVVKSKNDLLDAIARL